MLKFKTKRGIKMWKYIDRLVKCGYSTHRAYNVCSDFVKNLSLVELEFFIASVEKDHVEKI